MNKIEIINNTDDPLPHKAIKKVAKKVLSILKIKRWWLTITFVSYDSMCSLNQEFRSGAQGATDVLTFCDPFVSYQFPFHYTVPGDSIICLSVVKENASNVGCLKTQELIRVIVHSILHLQGEEHKSYDFSSDPMLMKQEKIVNKIIKSGVGEWDF